MKTAFTIGTIILLIGPWSILSNISTAHPLDSVSRGSILYVGGSGPGNYTQIQDAIDNATSGDTIYVYAASSPYLENLRIAKTIQLLGENTNTTIIIGQNLHESVVTMSQAPNVTLAGFTIRYPISNNRTMVQVESSLTTIRNNYFNDIQENRDLNKKRNPH